MPKLGSVYDPPADLVLGTQVTARLPEADQRRQRTEALEILSRLRTRPGVILADEVGMGKTFVALAVACSVAIRSPRGPVVVMVPANLIDKWEQDLHTFCELYLDNRHPVRREGATGQALKDPNALRFGVARDSIALMKLLDDRPRERCHLILLAQGAMARRQTDKWTRLALIAEAPPSRTWQGQAAHSSKAADSPISRRVAVGAWGATGSRLGGSTLAKAHPHEPGGVARHLQRRCSPGGPAPDGRPGTEVCRSGLGSSTGGSQTAGRGT